MKEVDTNTATPLILFGLVGPTCEQAPDMKTTGDLWAVAQWPGKHHGNRSKDQSQRVGSMRRTR